LNINNLIKSKINSQLYTEQDEFEKENMPNQFTGKNA